MTIKVIRPEAARLTGLCQCAARLHDGGACYLFLKDLIAYGLSGLSEPNDVVAVSTDDAILLPSFEPAVEEKVKQTPCFMGQRLDVDALTDPVDANQRGTVGRIVFGGTVEWLQKNTSRIPDFLSGTEAFDLCLSAMVHKHNGLPWSIETAHLNDPVCDLPLGTILHIRHEPHWSKLPVNSHSRRWNVLLTARWFRDNMPESMPSFLKDS